MEVGKMDHDSKAYVVKEFVAKKTKDFGISWKDFKKSNSRKLQGRKHANDINILTLVTCLKSPKSALLLSNFSKSEG